MAYEMTKKIKEYEGERGKQEELQAEKFSELI